MKRAGELQAVVHPGAAGRYQEALNPENPMEYRHEGGWKEMEKRMETIRVKGGDPVEADVFWTVHGPVLTVDTEKHVAFSKRRSWEGYELETLIGWMNTCRAGSWRPGTARAGTGTGTGATTSWGPPSSGPSCPWWWWRSWRTTWARCFPSLPGAATPPRKNPWEAA